MRIAIAGATGVVGRHAVTAARERGHETVALTRADGVDIATGAGLDAALAGVDMVVDTANAGTTDQTAATAFFTTATANLHRAGAAAGVQRLVVLSIVGIDALDSGYYGAKLAHERAATAGPLPATVLRATQFHEFAAQQIGWTLSDGRASVFDTEVQTVAARTVGAALIDAAEAEWVARRPDLAGPERARLVDLARQLVAAQGLGIEIDPLAVPQQGLPGDGAQLAGPTFVEWLAGPDAQPVALR